MDKELAAFTGKIQIYGPAERKRILESVSWADELHREQRRASGEPYLVHPLGVASILIDLNLDADAVIAAMLHDSLEDTAATREAIRGRFGGEVVLMVEGVTKIADISATNKTIQEAENIRKMLFAMVKDIRVIFIKLADKLHNMRTLEYLPPERRKAAAQECLDIYAPLADRLGISWIKDELEDISLKHLNREVFNQIKEIVALKRGERDEFLNEVREAILREAASAGIPIEVNSRAKHFYSIYRKMRKRNKTPGDLYDLFGIRILCDGIEQCYTILGLVHRLWKPLDGRFKDYIAMPKSNGYQSLHTTVMAFTDAPRGTSGEGSEGRLLEIQIRTRQMHHVAEYGVASHWLYKKGAPGDISLVNRLKDWKLIEAENGNSESFLEDIKRELLKDSIYVFTPRGKVIELPVGATAIDFAYHIHTAVGEHCAGAKADGIIIPLGAELRNTQVVEILTSTGAHPHFNWLKIVKTSKARGKIRSWLQQNDDSAAVEKNAAAKKKAPGPPPEEPSAKVPSAKVPAAKEGPAKEPVIQRVIQPANLDASILQVRVADEKNMMIRFAGCCNPAPGDPIVGYVSRGRGIIIHRKNCGNLVNIPDFQERKINTEWENASSLLIKRFKIEARLSEDLFSEIEGAVRKYRGHLIEGRLEETSPGHLTGFFTMHLEEAADLKKALKNIRGIPGVFSIRSLL